MKINSKQPPEIEYVFNCLNVSKAKATFSFPQSERFMLDKSFSPNKFYDIPSQFRSLSPKSRRRIASSLERSRDKIGHHLSSSLDEKDFSRASTFGISRQDYYRGRSDKNELGPGYYDIKGNFDKKKPFYMGRRIQQTGHKNQPNCTTYHVSKQSYDKLSTNKNAGAPKLKLDYYPKHQLQSYDNRVPGPGAYSRGGATDRAGNTYRVNFQRKKAFSSFGVGQKLKGEKKSNIGPGSYQRFSQFGTPRYY